MSPLVLLGAGFAAAATTTGASQLDALVLLLLGGFLALGLPRISVRGRRRFWHGWVNSGLLPLLIGFAIGPAQFGWISDQAAHSLRPLLGLTLAAAGVLVGMQFRLSYIRQAGVGFIVGQSSKALIQFAAAFLPMAYLAMHMLPNLPLAISTAALVSMCAVTTAQRPPLSCEERVALRDIVVDHVMPSGWWNALALVGGSLVLSVGFVGADFGKLIYGHGDLLVVTPMILGLLCGWLTVRAPSKDDLYLFLLAVLALSGGLALAVDAVPLFFGILVGVVLVNVASRKSIALEQTLEELEQPLVVGVGLLAGLCMVQQPLAFWVWAIVPVLLMSRWLIRRGMSPTGSKLGTVRERTYAAPGAASVLLVGCAVAAHDPAPMLVVPLIAALSIATLISDMVERRRELLGVAVGHTAGDGGGA